MAAMQLAQWQTYFPLKRPLFVSVDVSSRQLLGTEFGRDVSSVLNTLKLEPGSLNLEIGEALVYEGQVQVAQLLDIVRSKGVSIALGDYGEGRSNLNRLRALPLSSVKIGADLIAGARANSRADTMLRSTISVAREMKLAVVAQGVANEAEAQVCLKLGCDFAQGSLFGAPMNAGDAQRFIAMNWKIDAPPRSRTA
jgi:EAL domain-containing protein (putative c-di-GMP-specific phosphodiesterase class I)